MKIKKQNAEFRAKLQLRRNIDNNPCPCGSGIRAKDCCKRNLTPQGILDKNIVFKLLKQIEPFNSFYNSICKQIGQFDVVHDPNLPPGIRAMVLRKIVNSKLVGRELHIRTVVCPQNHAPRIAHELVHFLLDAQGFPVIFSNQQNIADILNSSLEDPLVDSHLKQYGFDRTSDRKTEMRTGNNTYHKMSPS